MHIVSICDAHTFMHNGSSVNARSSSHKLLEYEQESRETIIVLADHTP